MTSIAPQNSESALQAHEVFTDFKWPSEKSVLMNAGILVAETKPRHFRDFWNTLMLPVMPGNFIFEIILIFQSTLMELEMEFIYDGKALLLTCPLTKNLVNTYFRKILNK